MKSCCFSRSSQTWVNHFESSRLQLQQLRHMAQNPLEITIIQSHWFLGLTISDKRLSPKFASRISRPRNGVAFGSAAGRPNSQSRDYAIHKLLDPNVLPGTNTTMQCFDRCYVTQEHTAAPSQLHPVCLRPGCPTPPPSGAFAKNASHESRGRFDNTRRFVALCH